MKICFISNKLQKTFNSDLELKKKYGSEQALKIKIRLNVLVAAANLSEVPFQKPERCHELDHDRKGQFAVDLKQPFRIIFKPSEPVQYKDDGGIDLNNVREIIILDVEDYHGK